MAYNENLIGVISVNTSANIPQYVFLASDGAIAAANGADAIGISQDAIDGTTDGPKPVKTGYTGVSKLKVDGNADAIAVGDLLTVEATTGYGVSKGGLATGDVAVAEALEASTADGDIISVLVNSPRCGQQN